MSDEDDADSAEAQRDPDALPDSTDLSGPCPRCGRNSTFQVIDRSVITTLQSPFGPKPSEQAVVLKCAYCTSSFAVIETRSRVSRFRGVQWWPALGAGVMSDEIPANVAAAYDEGKRCVSASAPNGAAAMFRTALTYIVLDKGSEAAKAGNDLKDKLAQMARDGGVIATLAAWMTHVRLYGNAGAHPDLFGDVSIEEAQEVARLVYTMVEMLYLLPATIAARQTQRRADRGVTPPPSPA